MQRILKCDGLFAEKWSREGEPQAVTPQDIRDMKAYIETHWTSTTPFDVVIGSKATESRQGQTQGSLLLWLEAGVT